MLADAWDGHPGRTVAKRSCAETTRELTLGVGFGAQCHGMLMLEEMGAHGG